MMIGTELSVPLVGWGGCVLTLFSCNFFINVFIVWKASVIQNTCIKQSRVCQKESRSLCLIGDEIISILICLDKSLVVFKNGFDS